MKLVVGLGNPGDKHLNNRHNVGFMTLDKLVANGKWNKNKQGKLHYSWIKNGDAEIELVKPQTFMNNSGDALLYVKSKHPDLETNAIYVVHDDLDLALGDYKIQKGKGPKDHKGLNSLYSALKTKDFWHVRIGVDNRNPKNRMPGETYVLQDFRPEELITIQNVIGKVIPELLKFITHQELKLNLSTNV